MATITESIADRLTGGKLSNLQETAVSQAERISEQSNQLFQLTESLQRLEQVLYSSEWRMMTMQADQEFSRAGMRQITELARIMRLKNPVIKRGVKIQRLYVWAQGVNISAVEPKINDVVQAFLDDERNKAELTSHQARGERETDLQQDGNLFFRFHVNQINGRIRVSSIDPQEIDDIICNPEDKKEPWFYRRSWVQKGLDGSTKQHTAYYPDWRFTPRPDLRGRITDQISRSQGAAVPVEWDTPVYHIAVNRMGRFGVPEFYAANDWALAYKSFLEQLASVWQALARWAAKLTTKGGKRGVVAAKSKLNTTLGSSAGGEETNPPPVTGATFIASEGVDLQPFRTAGATMSAEDGRRLLLMTIMDFGFPETFFGDASVGSLATAKSLDRPTELQIMDRQALWRDIHSDIIGYALLWAVKAPQGPLRSVARVVPEKDGEQVREVLTWNDDIDPTVTIDFPSIIQHDTKEAISAIIDAQTLAGRSEGAGIPLETAVRRLVSELGINDVDAVMEIWQQAQAERRARADEMAARMSSSPTPAANDARADGEDQPSDDVPGSNDAMEAWQRMTSTAETLLTELRESVNGNGQQA
jgi:hypothetical protein